MTKDLTVGSPMKLILGFAVPLLFGLLLQQMYSLVDTMIVGKMLGANALAAVGASGSINFLVLGFCMGLCAGFAIPIAQRFGAKDMKGLRKYLANSMWLCIIASVVLTTVTIILCNWIMKVMKTPDEIYTEACGYIRIMFMGIPVIILYNMLSGIIRSLGDSKTPVIFLAMAAMLNVFLDILFIAVFKTDASGTALATVIAQGISGIACFFYMKKKFSELAIQPDEFKWRKKYVKNLCLTGVPMGLQYSVTAIGSVILQSAVNTLGTAAVAAMAAASKLSFFFNCPYDALGTTMATYGGQNVGAGKLDRLTKGLVSASGLGIIYAILAFVVLYIFAPELCLLFVNSESTEIISLMKEFLVINSSFYVLLVLVNVVRFMIQGMGFGIFSIFSGLSEMVARALFGFIFVPMFGFTAACFASPAAWLFADMFLIPGYIYCLKRLKKQQNE